MNIKWTSFLYRNSYICSDIRNAGLKADVDVYHSDTHAFDMLKPQDEISRQAIMTFEAKAERAIQEIKSFYN